MDSDNNLLDRDVPQAELGVVKNEIQRLLVESNEPQQMLLLLKSYLKRVEGRLQPRRMEVSGEQQHHNTSVSQKKAEILLTEQRGIVQDLNNHWTQKVAASQEAEKLRAGEKNVRLKVNNMKTDVLQNQHSDGDPQFKGDNKEATLLKDKLQVKVHQLTRQLQEKDEELRSLRKGNERLSGNLQETTENQQRRKAELLQRQDGWKVKYNNLKEKLRQELPENEQTATSPKAERRKVPEPIDENVKSKKDSQKTALLHNQLQRMAVNRYNQQVLERDQELQSLREENDCLSLSLQETTENLRNQKADCLQSENDLQLRYVNLQEKLQQELDESEQVWGTRLRELQEELSKKEEEEELRQKREQEDQDDLHQKLAGLTDKMEIITKKLLESNKAWLKKCTTLQEKFKEELLLKGHSLESRAQQLEEGLKDLKEELRPKLR